MRLAGAGRPEDKFDVRAKIVAHVKVVVEVERVDLIQQLLKQEVGILHAYRRLNNVVQVHAVEFVIVLEFHAEGVIADGGDFNLNLCRLRGGVQVERNIFQLLHELRDVTARLFQDERALGALVEFHAPEAD